MAPKKVVPLPSAKELGDMTIKDLKDLCQKRSIDQGGKKDDLIKKLLSHAKAEKASEKPKADNKTADKSDKKDTAKVPAAKAASAKSESAPAKTASAKPEPAKAAPAKSGPAGAKAVTPKSDKSAAKPTLSDTKAVKAPAVAPSPKAVKPAEVSTASSSIPAKSPFKLPAKSPVKSPAKRSAPVIPEGPFKVAARITPGSTVVLRNLVGQADLNGRQAQVVEWMADKGRWQCKLLEKRFVANFRPSNLELPIAPGAIIELRGLKAQPESNGKHARVDEWVKSKGRWRCTIEGEDAETGDFLPNNMQLARMPSLQQPEGERLDLVGQCVILTGLRGNVELNGQEAEVMAWVEEKGRWDCNLKDGRQVTFKADNLALWNYATEPVAFEEQAVFDTNAWDRLKRLQATIAAANLDGAAEEPDAKRPRVA